MHNLNRTGPAIRESPAAYIIAVIAALALIGLPEFLVAREHLASPNLWFDESGQFFVSLGLHHYSPPNAPHGSLAKVVEYSRYMNGDPGGFTILLRFWIAFFGYSPVALRSLPFLCFLLTPIMILSSARRSGTNPVIAVLAASIPLGYPLLLHYSTEVRAYSMEVCAVTFLFFLPFWLPDEARDWTVFIIGCIAALLVASRYSAFVPGAAACLVALLPIRPLRAAVLRASRFALPIVIVAATCYLLFARHQITGGGRLPAVFEPFMLSGKDTEAMLALLRENFLEPLALPLTIYLLAAPFFAWLGPLSLSRLRSLVGRTFAFSALSVTIIAVASMAGRLPWAWTTRWSLGYQTMSACCLAMVVIALGTCLWQETASRPRKALGIAVLVGFIAAWSMQLERALRSEHPYYETIASHLEALARSGNAKSLKFFVQINATPTTRYLVEYGPLKSAFSYPRSFHFETPEEAKDKTPISAKDYDIVVLTHSQFAAPYGIRVAEGTAQVNAPPPPSCLLVLRQ